MRPPPPSCSGGPSSWRRESENVETTTRLARVVDVVDPTEGTVRLKRGVGKAAEMDLELESTATGRARRPGVPGASS